MKPCVAGEVFRQPRQANSTMQMAANAARSSRLGRRRVNVRCLITRKPARRPDRRQGPRARRGCMHWSCGRASPAEPATVRSRTSAIGRTCRIRSSSCQGKIDCAPSERACSGLSCTSSIKPSQPTATAARESGITLLRLPVPWLGSTMMGKWLSRWMAGTMLRSSVLRE